MSVESNVLHIDFSIDISGGYSNPFPEVYMFKYRYKTYTFEVTLPRYNNGTPWTDIFNSAISKIIELENLTITKDATWGSREGIIDRVHSTTDTYRLEKRENLRDDEVAEIIGLGGFSRTYYVIHKLNDIDHKSILNGVTYDEDDNWVDTENLKALYDAVQNYNNPKTILANKLEILKKTFIDNIKPIFHEYADKFQLEFDEYLSIIGAYKTGDIVKTRYDEFYVISDVNNEEIIANSKLTLNHLFPEKYVEFKNNRDIKPKDINDPYYYGYRVNKSGILSIKKTNVYGIKSKVGETKEFTKPSELKKITQ